MNKLRPTSTEEHNISLSDRVHPLTDTSYSHAHNFSSHLPSILGKQECLVAKLCTTNHCVASFSKIIIISSLPKAVSKETQAMEAWPVDT